MHLPMKKILVVNNDFDTMSLLKTWLEKKGFVVKFSGNSSMIKEIMKQFDPDLLILDILQNLVLDNIRADAETRDVPVLLMTGYTMRKYNKCFPVDDTIEKPFDLSLMEKKIYSLLARDQQLK
jgi:CheY-like chemotaxis protein